MEYMYELKEKLCRELEEVARKPEMGAGDLELIHKLTDTIKNIDKIDALEDDGYSRGGDWEMEGRGNYSRNGGAYNRGSSYARRRDSRGRYTSDRRYSRDDAKTHMIEQMEQMMNGTQNEREREIIRRAMEQLEQV